MWRLCYMSIIDILKLPYVFALTIALLTSVLTYLLAKITEKDPDKPMRTFFKTLVSGAVVGGILTYLTSPTRASPNDVATEPFDAVAGGGDGAF